jgi:hypothetical protein
LAVGSDPDNGQSTPEHGLFDEQTLSDTCTDGVDNDLDGKRDRKDRGCRATCRDFARRNDCKDRDHDGWLKYLEVALGSDPKDPLSTPEAPLLFALSGTCSDGVDNDRDGFTDAGDSRCNPPEGTPCIDFDSPAACDPF